MERFLTGFRVKFKTLEKIASEYNFSLFPSDKSPFFTKEKIPDNCFLLAGNLNETTLKKLNYLPFSGIIDANAQKKSVRMFLSDLPKNEHHLSFLCTSPLIYSVDIADFFVKKLSESLNLSDQMKTDIRLALHETLINALVHGNLEISTGQVKTAYDFMNYTNLLQERLKSSSFAKKSVCIYASWNTHKLVIRVKDEGNGYKHKKNTTIIQMWHALAAIKKFGYQTIGYTNGLKPKIAKVLCMHKNYDYVISGSKEMNKYFAEAFNVEEEQVKEIATIKLPDLNAYDLEAAVKIVKGTALNMGIEVK